MVSRSWYLVGSASRVVFNWSRWKLDLQLIQEHMWLNYCANCVVSLFDALKLIKKMMQLQIYFHSLKLVYYWPYFICVNASHNSRKNWIWESCEKPCKKKNIFLLPWWIYCIFNVWGMILNWDISMRNLLVLKMMLKIMDA